MKHFFTILSHEIRMLLVNPSTYIAAVRLPHRDGLRLHRDPRHLQPGAAGDFPGASSSDFCLPVFIIVPLTTMKCFSEERRLGHDGDPADHAGVHHRGGARKIRRRLAVYLRLWGSTGGLFYLLHQFAGDPRLLDRGTLIGGYVLHCRFRSAFRRHRGLRERAGAQPGGGAGSSRLALLFAPDLRRQVSARHPPCAQDDVSAPCATRSTTPRFSGHSRISAAGWSTCASCSSTSAAPSLALIFSILSVEAKLLHS